MPWSPPTLCSGRGPDGQRCNKLVRGRFCRPCLRAARRDQDRRRPPSSRRGYGGVWRKVRRAYLDEHPTCEEPGCRQPAADVDHVVPLRRGGTNEDENLRALCRRHHSRKTAREDGGFGNPKLERANPCPDCNGTAWQVGRTRARPCGTCKGTGEQEGG